MKKFRGVHGLGILLTPGFRVAVALGRWGVRADEKEAGGSSGNPRGGTRMGWAAGYDCCGGFGNVDIYQVARWEHKTRKLSQAFGSPYVACYCLGTTVLLLNFLRSHCFTQAMLRQPKMEGLDCLEAYYVGLVILGIGIVFVLSSFHALGFIGTYLGDYFGILKEARVTKFPFNVLDNPMYWGSTANYLGWSIMNASPTGLMLTIIVALTYTVAIVFEEPFTEEIYRHKALKTKNK
ncbi:phosphatidylethanolamine N-methyltransferase isoform X2 [Antechinus flavipes]|uniref:phosphatidylethanolamine N-methyltransferase isoform X2 n=1 Tax=Antechinus flavipes TaxID=38775 RepID=UPI00223695CB|nr:phosphatidylethanolamine N-methyltransferase isoform X2 [Antechinus flavipes]